MGKLTAHADNPASSDLTFKKKISLDIYFVFKLF